jgi:hypothetical protein
MKSLFTALPYLLILVFSSFPLLFDLPFRDNIYLSWEGAYRIYQGQMPFVDFGMPLGYGYWLLPSLGFHVFGPSLFSLIKIQVFINIISGIAFLSLVKRFTQDKGLILTTLFLYLVSYSFFNFWPWYNHSVIVFEFIGLAFLLIPLMDSQMSKWKRFGLLGVSAFFIFLSLFTKQDGGAFALFISGILLIYFSIIRKELYHLLFFGASYLAISLIFILPLIPHEFGYWFNYGQAPHYSRISLYDFMSTIFGASHFIKFYFLLIILIVLYKSREGVQWLMDLHQGLFLLLTLGVLFQASILQVTSYVPVDGNLYFHSFMFLYIICNLPLKLDYSKWINTLVLMSLVLFWWSGVYWKYASRMFSSFAPKTTTEVVSMSSYTNVIDTVTLDKSKWRISEEKAFHHIKLPPDAVDAIEILKSWSSTKSKDVKVLNMSELTPLAEVMGYELEKGMPLWYHLNVGMFDRELKRIEGRIENGYYDMVIFEVIPQLNNFYPFHTREVLKENYDVMLTFQAPREYTTEFIEVYVKRNEKD